MPDIENIVTILCLTIISIAALMLLPDGGGKEVTLTVGGGLAGYLVKAVKK